MVSFFSACDFVLSKVLRKAPANKSFNRYSSLAMCLAFSFCVLLRSSAFSSFLSAPPPTTTPLRMYLDGMVASSSFPPFAADTNFITWNKRSHRSSGVPPVFKPALFSASLISSSFMELFNAFDDDAFLPFAMPLIAAKSNLTVPVVEATTPLSSHPFKAPRSNSFSNSPSISSFTSTSRANCKGLARSKKSTRYSHNSSQKETYALENFFDRSRLAVFSASNKFGSSWRNATYSSGLRLVSSSSSSPSSSSFSSSSPSEGFFPDFCRCSIFLFLDAFFFTSSV
mmetsp:Transcript_3620/g.12137  ORF Transcript_3620/g.12137 Transcript_3620/m.12137 type:complete len:284 (+) Transcript_3620:494-1345(+)